MKLSFSSNAFRRFSLEDTIRFLAETGYQGIEIMCDVPHAYPPEVSAERLLSIRKTVEENNIVIANLNGFMLTALGDFHHPSWIESDLSRRRQRLEYTRQCLDLAAALGVRTISTEPGGPLDGLPRQEALSIFLQGIKALSGYARNRGVRILVEPEPNLLLETSEEFCEFINQVDQETVGLNLDIGHFYCVNEEPSDVIKTLAPFIGHVHLEDIGPGREHRHLPPGQGVIDFKAVAKALNQIGYDGFLTVELYPFQDNPREVAQAAWRYFQAIFH